LEHGGWSVVGRGLQTMTNNAPTVKPEAPSAVGAWRLERCWSWSADHDQQHSNGKARGS